MIEVGRLAVKTAGRDAGKKCVIVDILENNLVLIDGETRRRKCNILHLEPLKDLVKVKKNASHEEVKKEFEKLGLKVMDTKPKPKTEKPVKQKKVKEKADKKTEAKKPKKKETKKVEGLEEKAGFVEKKETKKKSEDKKKK